MNIKMLFIGARVILYMVIWNFNKILDIRENMGMLLNIHRVMEYGSNKPDTF